MYFLTNVKKIWDMSKAHMEETLLSVFITYSEPNNIIVWLYTTELRKSLASIKHANNFENIFNI